MRARAVQVRLRELASPTRAAGARSFFKTGPGQYGEGDQFLGLSVPEQRRVAEAFRINNWDLVDTSARYIVGEHLRDRSRARVYRLARSKDVWERRIAMVATHAWVASGDTADAYAIANLLLDDTHDLIRKAVGWMLREAGVYDRTALLRFLRMRYARVSRTTLRYAIEHLPAAQRKRILAGDFA